MKSLYLACGFGGQDNITVSLKIPRAWPGLAPSPLSLSAPRLSFRSPSWALTPAVSALLAGVYGEREGRLATLHFLLPGVLLTGQEGDWPQREAIPPDTSREGVSRCSSGPGSLGEQMRFMMHLFSFGRQRVILAPASPWAVRKWRKRSRGRARRAGWKEKTSDDLGSPQPSHKGPPARPLRSSGWESGSLCLSPSPPCLLQVRGSCRRRASVGGSIGEHWVVPCVSVGLRGQGKQGTGWR